MKNKSNFSNFEGGSRRRGGKLPIIPIAIAVLVVLLLVFLWSRGGEQAQKPVEKVIPAEKLGQ